MHPALLATDQIRCYAESGEEMPCAGTGQDAAFKRREPGPWRHRFQPLGDLVRDTWTGAVWTRDANPAEFPLSWAEAFAFTQEMRGRRVHGRDNWQLPSRRLLFSLVSHQYVNPALPLGHPFENVFHGYYWTGDRCRRLSDQAWYAHMGGGRIHRGMKHGSYLVWPVSPEEDAGGSTAAQDSGKNGRFTVDGDSVRDARTGLTWLNEADVAGRPLTWDAALSAVAALNRESGAGEPPWRLPNIRELESLVDLQFHSPALTTGHPFHHVRDAYWSSTTSVYEPRYAWTLYSRDGFVGVGFKPRGDFYAWPVRGP